MAQRQPFKKLSKESHEAIRAIYAEGFTSYGDLSKQFGITRSAIGHVVRNTRGEPGSWNDPEVLRNKRLARLYGMTSADYDALWMTQDGKCASCGDGLVADRSTHVDHCHETDTVRSLLCRPCNLSLGQMREDPVRLRKLATYAETHCIQLSLVA